MNSKKCSGSIKLLLILEISSHVSWISAGNPGLIASGNNSLSRGASTNHRIIPIQPQIPPLPREGTWVEPENSKTRRSRKKIVRVRQSPDVPLTQPHWYDSGPRLYHGNSIVCIYGVWSSHHGILDACGAVKLKKRVKIEPSHPTKIRASHFQH